MNEFLVNLVSLIADDEDEDDSSVTIVEYGNSDANVLISFDMATRTTRQQLIATVSNNIDYCDSTTNDNDHYCEKGIDLVINEIENNSGSTIGDDINNVLVLIQNGACSDDESTCDDNTLKEQIETLNIRTIVLNFGPNANSDENVCIVTESGEQRYEDDISNTMTFLETFGERYFCRDVDNDFDDSCNFVEETNTVFVIDRSTPFDQTPSPTDDDDDDDLLPCEEMNEFLINLVRNRANEEFGRISIIEYDNDDVPQVILSLNDVPLEDNNRRDTIIQSVIDNVDYCDNSAQPGDENNYCQEGIEAGVMEMMNNGNVGIDGDNNVIIVIQNGECNENPDICTETDNNGNTLVERVEISDIKLVVLNVGPDAVENENECIVTYDGSQIYERDIPTMQEELEDTNIFCREVNITTTSPPLQDSCNMPNKKNFAIVVDQSEAFDDETCKEMNLFLTNLVSQLIDETGDDNDDKSRVSIIEYGSNSANILIGLDEFPLNDDDRKEKFLNKLEQTVDYCDNSTNDENHYCKQGIDLGKQEIFDNGNIVTDPTQSPSEPDENFLIILQNGDCNDNENVCENGDFKKELENVNVKSYVFNIGPNAIEDENDCIVTDNFDKTEYNEVSFDNSEDISAYFDEFYDKTCPMFGDKLKTLYPTNNPVSAPSQPPITDSCYLERRKNFVIVIDRSTPIGNNNEDCELMNEFIVDLVGLVLDEDYGRVGIVEYGNNGANVIISLNDYQISSNWATRRDTLIDDVILNVNYCDDSTNDDSHFCQEGIEMGRDDIIAYGNVDSEENVLIVIQNGECNENDNICNDDTFVNELLSNNIESFVLNFGPNAVEDENLCIVTEEQVYANDFQMLDTFLDHSEDRFCHKQRM